MRRLWYTVTAVLCGSGVFSEFLSIYMLVLRLSLPATRVLLSLPRALTLPDFPVPTLCFAPPSGRVRLDPAEGVVGYERPEVLRRGKA